VATRAQSSNANLYGLLRSSGAISPAFTADTTSYTGSVTNVISSMTVTPTAADPNATITVDGVAVASGTASQSIPLNVGPNTITIVVTAADGVTTQTYTLVVTRAGSSNATLISLLRSNGAISPAFNADSTNYTSSVAGSISSMTVTPTASDPNATITVNGTTVASGTASASIPLLVGPNTITIVVTASDGATTQTYTLVVTRASAGGGGGLTSGGYTRFPFLPPGLTIAQLATNDIVVHQGVSPNGDGINDFLQIDNINLYPDNKLTIMNRNGQLIYEANGYDNSSKVFDGHSNKNGQMQLPGTYFYQLDYTVNGIIKHKTGFLVLKY
jgi:gliding motility-associated-like protein